MMSKKPEKFKFAFYWAASCGGCEISDEIALDLASEKLANTTKAGADCITTLCPFCFVALDIGQVQLRSKRNETYDIPVLHYSELLALATGISPEELALKTHKIKIDKIIAKLK